MYISNNNREKINFNRTNIPLLKNDTDNVIEFNSGYNDKDNKVKRNFWNLFKK